MSAYFKYGFIAITKQAGTSVIVILQLSILLIAMNLVIGNYNSRDMLCKPFSDITSKEGYYFSINSYNQIEDENGTLSVDSRSKEEILDSLLPKLRGNPRIYKICTAIVTANKGYNTELHLVFVDDEIFNKFTLPLQKGEWSSSLSDKMNGVITHSRNNIDINDTVECGGKIFTVSGVLTDISYVPDFNHFSAGSGIKNFYNIHNYETDQFDYMMLPLSADESKIAVQSMYSILIFDDTLSDTDKRYNEEMLSGPEVDHKVKLSEINKQSEIYLNEDLSKNLPLIICAWIIAISGLITSCAIQAQRNIRDYAVFYLCGSKWVGCLFINLISTVIIVFISATFSFVSLFIIMISEFSNQSGIVIASDNILISLCICMISIGLSMIIPAIIINRNSAKNILAQTS